MIRRLATVTTTALIASLAAAVVTSLATPAFATPASGPGASAAAIPATSAPGAYQPGGGQQLLPGTGSSTGTWTADPTGRMTVDTSATGGRQFGDPEPASGTAQANVTDSFAVNAGTYRVTATYRGVGTRETARGNASTETVAEIEAFFSPEPFQGWVVGQDETELDTGRRVLSQVLLVTLSKPGDLTVTAEIEASSYAYVEGAKAGAAARTSSVAFTVERVG